MTSNLVILLVLCYALCADAQSLGVLNGLTTGNLGGTATLLSTAGSACPPPYVESTTKCLRFINTRMLNWVDARSYCASIESRLLMVQDMQEASLVSGWLNANANPKTEMWYTSGQFDPQVPGRAVWDGYDKEIGAQYSSLWLIDLNWYLDPANLWLLSNTKVLYAFDGLRWGFNISDGNTLRPFICQTPKAIASQVISVQRDYTYGVLSPADYVYGPQFTLQPVDTVFMSDSTAPSVTLECFANALPAPKYNWYKLQGGTMTQINPLSTGYSNFAISNGRLTIYMNPAPSVNPGASYQCMAYNDYGQALSNTALLTIGFVEQVDKTDKSPIYVSAYTWTVLKCNPPAHNPDQLNYNWYLDETAQFVRTEYKPWIFVSGNGNLYFSYVTQEDNGNYYCVISSPYSNVGQKGSKQPLVVTSQLETVQEPHIDSAFPAVLPTSPLRGQNVTLECFATGKCTSQYPLQYSWQRLGGLQIPQKAVLLDWNRKLVIPNVELGDSGQYLCSVQRINGQSDQRSVNLNINAAPFMTLPLTDQYVDAGTTVVLRCDALGMPTPTFSWWRGGQPFKPSDPRFTILNNKLTITAVQNSDSATYQCSATNTYGTVFTTSNLKILSIPPNFFKHPVPNTIGAVGGNVTIRCAPEAAPTPTITWALNGTNLGQLPEATLGTSGQYECASDKCSLPTIKSLLIVNLAFPHTGLYTCTATNSLGSASSSGFLTVVAGVSFIINPNGISAYTQQQQLPNADPATIFASTQQNFLMGSNFFLRCGVTVPYGVDNTYVWQINGINFYFDRVSRAMRHIYNTHFRQGTGAEWGNLYIYNITFDYQWWYVCQVKTSFGVYISAVMVNVFGIPGPCAGLYVDPSRIGPYDLVLQWMKGDSRGSALGFITNYYIEAFDNYTSVWYFLANVTETPPVGAVDFGIRSTHLTGLAPKSGYQFRVRAVNSYGVGEASATYGPITTLSAAPRTAPFGLTASDGKSGTLNVTWKPFPRMEWGADNGYFKIASKLVEEGSLGTPSEDSQNGLEKTQFTKVVGDDNYRKRYNISISSCNAAGCGPWSDTVTVYSAEAMPTVIVSNVRVNSYNSTACLVFWNKVDPNDPGLRGTIRGYRINYYQDRGSYELNMQERQYSRRQTVWGQVDEAYVYGLLPDTYYRFYVQVFNGAGNGPQSGEFKQTTWRLFPQSFPLIVSLHKMAVDTVLVKFVGVTVTVLEETLDGYIIRYWVQGADVRTAINVDCDRNTFGYINGLSENTYYNLRVFAYSRGGDGLMSFLTRFVLRSDCISGTYDNLDVRYIYICAGCALAPLPLLTLLVLALALFLARNRDLAL